MRLGQTGQITKQNLVIWGASGHASVIADIVRLRDEYELIGFLDDTSPERWGTEFCGAPILGGRGRLEELHRGGVRVIVLGFGDCQARLRLGQVAREKGFEVATVVHPNAVIAADVEIGAGTVISAGVVINPGAKIGEAVIVNTSASVDHHCTVEDGAHICPGVRLAGSVVVGRAAWVGVGATIVDGARIGAETTIGAGAVVLDDIPEGVVAYGVPARIARKETSG